MLQRKYSKIREELHRHPELSGEEIHTATFVQQCVKEDEHTSVYAHVGGCGVVVECCFSSDGPTLLFRADMDAVAVAENIPTDYSSQVPGVSHKCGHDGHTAILLAFVALLQKNPLEKGRILLLFQPSEENGQGAQNVLKDPFFERIKIDKVYALHNLPGFPFASIVCRAGSFTCSVVSCMIKIIGKTAHAAEPENGISPTPALVEILRITQSWNDPDIESDDYFRSTLIELHIGEEAYGVAAGEGVIRLTFRAATEVKLQQYKNKLTALVEKLTIETQGLRSSLEWLEAFAANENDPMSVNVIKNAVNNEQLKYIEMNRPFAWGEDFGLFTQRFKGAMLGLGAGNIAPLHSPDYDFPNGLIEVGAKLFYKIAKIETES
ncbi:MAG: amidohydrolase [Odoribacter sp.]